MDSTLTLPHNSSAIDDLEDLQWRELMEDSSISDYLRAMDDGFDLLEGTEDEIFSGYTEHADLDDVIYWRYHQQKKYLDNPRNSLVFSHPVLEEARFTSSFDSLCQVMEILTDDGGVQKCVLKKGNGVAPKKDAQVWVHYIMFTEKEPPLRQPFDSTKDRQRLDTFKLNGEKLPCMNIALESMDYEEVSLFIGTSDYAYGQLGCPPRIQPDSKILFIIELTALDVSTRPPIALMTEEKRQNLEFSEILEEVQGINEKGNEFFKEGFYDSAVRCYEIGIEIIRSYVAFILPAAQEKKERQLYNMYSNLAATYLNLGEPHMTCEIFETVIQLGIPMLNGKLYYRHAKALWEQNKMKEALKSLNQALKVEPGHFEVLALRYRVVSRITAEEKEGAALAKKMSQLFTIPSLPTDSDDKKGPVSIPTTIPRPVQKQFSAEAGLNLLLPKRPSIIFEATI